MLTLNPACLCVLLCPVIHINRLQLNPTPPPSAWTCCEITNKVLFAKKYRWFDSSFLVKLNYHKLFTFSGDCAHTEFCLTNKKCHQAQELYCDSLAHSK